MKDTIIVKPVVTEKALSRTGESVYVFKVGKYARKEEIKHQVEKMFDVEVKAIKTAPVKGKSIRTGRKGQKKQRPDMKKAYISLKKGKIDIIPASQS